MEPRGLGVNNQSPWGDHLSSHELANADALLWPPPTGIINKRRAGAQQEDRSGQACAQTKRSDWSG